MVGGQSGVVGQNARPTAGKGIVIAPTYVTRHTLNTKVARAQDRIWRKRAAQPHRAGKQVYPSFDLCPHDHSPIKKNSPGFDQLVFHSAGYQRHRENGQKYREFGNFVKTQGKHR